MAEHTIVIDTSALIAILQDEPEAQRCIDAIATAERLLISAGTFAEALTVADRRGARSALEQLIGRLKPEIVPVDAKTASLIADAYSRWGKGVHPAGLNFGDCFAYALAKHRSTSLLYVGDDFAKTDVNAS